MGCNNMSANEVAEVQPASMNKQPAMQMAMSNADYLNRAVNKNWPTITYFGIYGRGSAIHF
jgi:hypothetical protein